VTYNVLTGRAIFEHVSATFPEQFEFVGYTGWPWSKTVAIDGEGETIIVNRRKISAASVEDYVGTIWHELSHKAGYFHAGNARKGNECTVPHLVGDAAVLAAMRKAKGAWGELPNDACPGLKTALASVSPKS
jgi:hypothetical protein